MILNLGSGAHPIPGAENLDKENGWTFESGLRSHAAASIEGITISHALMYVALEHWPFVFSEIARVLEPGGVVRITEDATDDPRSERYGGFHDAVTLTSVSLVLQHLGDAGLYIHETGESVTHFGDRSLCQSWHGGSPKCLFVEGVKPR